MQNISPSRPSPIAGSWYPGNPDKLAESIDRYFAGARLPAMKGEVVGLIAPHAGHIYSGQTAAYAFKTVHGKKYDIVVVISPSTSTILHPFWSADMNSMKHRSVRSRLTVRRLTQWMPSSKKRA